MHDFMDEFYLVRSSERDVFGALWCGPEKFQHGKDTLVAKVSKSPADGDGYDVEVYCCALPSRGYKVVALPTRNSVNEQRPGFALSTGSDMARFAMQFAEYASEGMLGLESAKSGEVGNG